MVSANIVAIGDEILIGQITDTNSSWLAQKLTEIGIKVNKTLAIADNKTHIINALENGLAEADILIFTGGLGPTKDDITKKTFANYFNTELEFSEDVYADVLNFLENRGGQINDLNKQQALVPIGATILSNKQGTAAGLVFKKEEKLCICLPGVPYEMKGIMQQYGLTYIKNTFKLNHNYYHNVLITGIAEAHLAERLSSWENELSENISLAYLPSPGLIKLRLGASGDNMDYIETLVLNEVEMLKKLIPELIFGENNDTLELQISKMLIEKNALVSTAESCTGGNIAKLFTTLPGSSNWYNGSVVAYSNSVKSEVLKVPEAIIQEAGAVSEQVVKLMAKGAKEILNTDYSIASSGIAGPSGGTQEKPVGTVWLAVSGPQGEYAKCYKFGKEREINIRRSSIAALNLLRKYLLGELL